MIAMSRFVVAGGAVGALAAAGAAVGADAAGAAAPPAGLAGAAGAGAGAALGAQALSSTPSAAAGASHRVKSCRIAAPIRTIAPGPLGGQRRRVAAAPRLCGAANLFSDHWRRAGG